MKRRWKVALGVTGLLVAVGVGSFAWLAFADPSAAVVVDAGPSGRRIDADGLFGNYYPAAGGGRQPAILLLGGSEGGLSKDMRAQALLLQSVGFHTLQIAYHNAPGKTARLGNVPLEDFYRGLDWLKARPEVDASRIGIVGYSKGAEAGLLVATRYPGIRAAALGMPSSVVWDGLSFKNYLFSVNSSWSEQGKPLPHVSYQGRRDETGVPKAPRIEADDAAVIPVEKFAGKLLLVCGGAERLWASCPMADQIVARAVAKGAAAPIVLRYPKAGHGVMGAPFVDRADAEMWAQFGGTVTDNNAARADNWPKIVAFLKAEL